MSLLKPAAFELEHRAWLACDWALIDPGSTEPDLLEPITGVSVATRALPLGEALLPRLACLKSLGPMVRTDLMDRANGWLQASSRPLFGALLETCSDEDALVTHLATRMVVQRHGHGAIWLRFHDHRVFGHLTRVLTPGQLADLMGPISAWSWFDHYAGSWLRIARPEAKPVSLRSLDATQWQLLERIELINRLEPSLRRRLAGAGLDHGAVHRIDELLGAVIAADGKSSRRDICLRVEQLYLHDHSPDAIPPQHCLTRK